ncbi:hypothetical protein [Polaribacter porphyrae]|uniref:Lipoprotein n=1 Tax=Polaribacter porphyrae TaxID=1137780 RepID=A0A2S7WSB5_9FLAO|nr:hypothetical protein [Polaribacter porphyrae]PQJ80212.1 hypothetical protein BTO18_13965 [Polaribacter porphyrae]
MKYIKNIKLVLISFFLMLGACNSKEEKKQAYAQNPNIYMVELEDGETIMLKKDYYDTFSFENWNNFNVANTRLLQIEENDYKTSINRLVNLKPFIRNLSETAPEWLKTEEVLEDINDVEKEYKELLKEIDGSTKEVRENCKELNEEFDELRENINEIVEDYTNS